VAELRSPIHVDVKSIMFGYGDSESAPYDWPKQNWKNIFEIKESPWNVGPGRLMSELKSPQADNKDCVLYDVIHRKRRRGFP